PADHARRRHGDGRQGVRLQDRDPPASRGHREEAQGRHARGRAGGMGPWPGCAAESALRTRAHEPARGAVARLDLRDRHADRPPPRAHAPSAIPAEPLRAGSDGRAAARVPLMAIPARPIDPARDRDRRLAESRASYLENPYQFRDRRLGESRSPWVRGFACDDMKVLIVCRGPIRKEAIDVFREMGMTDVGMLLSEKDSIVYPRALSPELRIMNPRHVHPLPDYTGATKEERVERVLQIIRICREHGYEYVFAGYGFMAEDAE